jgi:hypothetical protein
MSKITGLGQKLSEIVAKPDRQSSGLRDLEVADQSFADAFRQHFAGSPVLEDKRKVRAATVLYNTLRQNSVKQLEIALDMGRALLRAEEVFTPAEWKQMVAGGQRILGVAPGTATMCRQLARQIDGGALPRELCPEAFSVAYVFATYEPWRIKYAIEQRVLRPNVTRREAMEFKRLAAPESSTGLEISKSIGRSPDNAVHVRARIKALRKKERRLRDALSACQLELNALENEAIL